MFFASGIWCLADVSSVSPSSEQTFAQPICSLNTGRPVLKKIFFCVGEYAEYGFDQQRLIWYVFRQWDMVFS